MSVDVLPKTLRCVKFQGFALMQMHATGRLSSFLHFFRTGCQQTKTYTPDYNASHFHKGRSYMAFKTLQNLSN